MKLWYENDAIYCSKTRTMDRQTMVNLLELLEYQQARSSALEQLGFEDKGDPTDVLIDYVLDALGAPPNEFTYRNKEYNRSFLYDIFYEDYVKCHKFKHCADALVELEKESLAAALETGYINDLTRQKLAS